MRRVNLSPEEVSSIEEGVTTAMLEHMRSKDAATGLSHYAPGARVVSNGYLYRSFEDLKGDVEAFYETLGEVDLAIWDDMIIDALSPDAAAVTATFRWSSRDTSGVRTDLKGVWTAVWVREDQRWRIRARHESFMAATRNGT